MLAFAQIDLLFCVLLGDFPLTNLTRSNMIEFVLGIFDLRPDGPAHFGMPALSLGVGVIAGPLLRHFIPEDTLKRKRNPLLLSSLDLHCVLRLHSLMRRFDTDIDGLCVDGWLDY